MDNFSHLPKQKKDPVSRQYVFGVVLALAIFASFVGGYAVANARKPVGDVQAADPVAAVGKVLNIGAKQPDAVKDVDFNDFWEIWETVKERHVGDPADDKKMFYGAVAGMVASLGDPYSVFFDPKFAQEFAAELGGEFEGIGAEIGIKQDQLTVVAPLPGTPAEKAGIRSGDRIVGIDEKGTVGMTTEAAVRLIRGEKGTAVKLHIMREGFAEPKEFVITRAKIVVEPVKWEMVEKDGKKVAHVTITSFNDKTVPMFRDAVRSVLLQDPAGIVLDLRNNPGGYLDGAVDVAGEWVGDGMVVNEKFGDGRERPYSASGNARLADVPTVVLINGGSASASEIVSGALQDYGFATLVGEKSFGKGSVQDFQNFADGSALKLTVALWYTPKDRNINKEGIVPDVEVENTTEDFNNDRDPQLDKALELLTATKK